MYMRFNLNLQSGNSSYAVVVDVVVKIKKKENYL